MNNNLRFNKVKNPIVIWGSYAGYTVDTNFGCVGELILQDKWMYSPDSKNVLLESDDLRKIIKKLDKLNAKVVKNV